MDGLSPIGVEVASLLTPVAVDSDSNLRSNSPLQPDIVASLTMTTRENRSHSLSRPSPFSRRRSISSARVRLGRLRQGPENGILLLEYLTSFPELWIPIGLLLDELHERSDSIY